MKCRDMTNLPLLVILCFSASLKTTEGNCDPTQSCVTDLSQKDCKEKEFLTLYADVTKCCPKCVKYSVIGEVCGSTMACAPGLECISRVCKIDNKACLRTLHLNDKDKPMYPPKCDLDGTYAPVQCKGDRLAGRCFCNDANGKRIFGMAWTKDADDMTCACSRRRSELEAEGRTDVTLHCTSNGNYEPLQCDNGLCWCADNSTGIPISPVVMMESVAHLPCYDADTFGFQYLRKCESKNYGVEVLKKTLAVHGTTSVSIATLNCDYDGSYGVYQVKDGIAYCSWKDGERIGTWQSEAGISLKDVNCNCARDKKYFEEVGQTQSQKCQGNGNYEPQQIDDDGRTYCVDSDGYPLREPGADVSDCYNNNI